jgi:single-stranded-DNA-specific exonuclease
MSKLLTKEDIFNLLYNRHKGEFVTLKELPYPNTFKDMQRAVKRVKEAINCNEKIVLIGDYDVDGVTATTVIRELFKCINYPLEWIIPNRFSDGYGLSTKIIDRVQADVIITVDNGIAALEAASLCKERGIDLIITDHHTVPSVAPEAYAIVNQKQESCKFKYKEICGAQIAWYFSAALAKELNIKLDTKELMGITSLAIVADIMPLTGINRAMLIAGMEYLKRSKKPFVKALKDRGIIKNTLDSQSIAFYIAPLLNSAGRLKDASVASDFLFTNSQEEANIILDELIELNTKRKEIERNITKEAISQVSQSSNIAVVWGSNWSEGVVGIVASKVAEHFKIPAIVLSCKDGICKGSGRSWGDCDLYSLVNKASEYYLKFGGHKSAIGLSFEQDKMPLIKNILNLEASNCSKEYVDNSILGELPFNQIDFELLDILDKFEPYGEANSKPKFTNLVEIVDVSDIGANKEHRRYRFKDATNRILSAVEFRSKKSHSRGDSAKLTFSVGRNEYNGNVYINLYVDELY